MRREPYFEAAHDPRRDARPESDDAVHPLRAPRAFARTRIAARFVFAAAIIAGLAVVARERAGSAAVPRAWAEPPPSAGLPVVRQVSAPSPLLVLDAADPPAQSEPPRWSAATGLREDGLVQGSFDAIEVPFLRVTLTEAAPASQPSAAPSPSLFVTLARRAAEMRGLSVTRTGLRGVIETKFGRFETVEAGLSGQGARLCTGFASLDARAMRIDGWLCGVLGQAPEPQALACAIDRLKLAVAAVPTIEVAFGAAELRRLSSCGAGVGAGLRAADETGSIARPGSGAVPGDPRRSGARPVRLTKK